jgi:hypothetical protein
MYRYLANSYRQAGLVVKVQTADDNVAACRHRYGSQCSCTKIHIAVLLHSLYETIDILVSSM